MATPTATPITLTDIEKEVLKHVAQTKGNAKVGLRARIILYAAEGKTNTAISQEVGMSITQVGTWRKKWAESVETTQQSTSWEELVEKTEAILSSKAGRPKLCEQQQVAQIVEISCRYPQQRSKHAQNELIASEAINRGIVRKISPRSVGRLLRKSVLAATS
ncbi:MAG: helix-turn-helix domain-containing protein [Scytonema sp. RU_4_4]|nr:helix-turn-helix domain-containing protein [Scytonema sp. RU_4_4]